MNLAGIIDRHPAAAPALVAGSGDATTYGGLRRAVAAMQHRLAAAGVRPDDRVAILSANDPAFVVGYLAVLRGGAVAVPLNILSPPAEVQRQLAQVEVGAVLVGPGAQHVAGAVAGLTGSVVLPLAGEPAPPGARQEEVASEPVARRAEDLAALLFTAGTAGSPRAAMLTHGNLLTNLEQVQRHPGRGVEASDRVLGVLPLCHIFGLNVVLGGALYAGATVVLVDRFEPAGTVEAIARHRVTIVVGSPTMFAALTTAPSPAAPSPAAPSPAAPDAPMASVRLAISGAAPLPLQVADAWQSRFGVPLRQGYGLTEASPVVTSALMDEVGSSRPTSIGVPIPGVELRLVDDDGDDALAGDPGEIWVRGGNVFAGYWHDADATEAALTPDGWLRTGDIAVVGDDGQLAIVDRAKDLIIVSGFNVYPAEVEEVLGEHPGVAEAAVIGEADQYRGEVVHAFVVLQDPGAALTAAQLREWCALRLAGYKCPTEVTLVGSLPHGLAGKVLRRTLRSMRTATAARGRAPAQRPSPAQPARPAPAPATPAS